MTSQTEKFYFKRNALLMLDSRNRLGLTQEEMGKALGMASGQYVSMIERGVAKLPVKYIDKFVELTGIPRADVATSILKDEYYRICPEQEQKEEQNAIQ